VLLSVLLGRGAPACNARFFRYSARLPAASGQGFARAGLPACARRRLAV